MENLLKRLENFQNGHKARWCRIFHDNGYGASCWEIEIGTENGEFNVSEINFYEREHPSNYYTVYPEEGLEAVLKLALDKAEELVNEKSISS